MIDQPRKEVYISRPFLLTTSNCLRHLFPPFPFPLFSALRRAAAQVTQATKTQGLIDLEKGQTIQQDPLQGAVHRAAPKEPWPSGFNLRVPRSKLMILLLWKMNPEERCDRFNLAVRGTLGYQLGHLFFLSLSFLATDVFKSLLVVHIHTYR